MFHVTVNYMCLVSSSTYLSTTSLVSYSPGLTAVLGWGWVAVLPSCDLEWYNCIWMSLKMLRNPVFLSIYASLDNKQLYNHAASYSLLVLQQQAHMVSGFRYYILFISLQYLGIHAIHHSSITKFHWWIWISTCMYQSAVLKESDIVMYYYFMQAFVCAIQLLTMHSLNAIKTEKLKR